ncbi:MAG: hypothetical protein MJE66_19010 [Proteobacteria bacterium]|nr:hypothetical protein [Pseudomonadota bacterium]
MIRQSLLFALSAFALALPAAADPTVSALIQIGSDAVSPTRVRMAAERGFAFRNETDAMARIVFDRKSAERLDCQAGEAATGRSGQFVLETGATLHCQGQGGTLGYTVYWRNSDGAVQRTKGRVHAP